MKKFLSLLFTAAMLLGGLATAASAHHSEGHDAGPGPNGNNNHGLCTAYFNGQKKGHERNGNPGPFQALEDAAEDDGTDEDDDVAGETAIESDVYEFCQAVGIGGQPEHNGRFDCESAGSDQGRDTDDDGQIECLPNDGEGDTGGDHPSDGKGGRNR